MMFNTYLKQMILRLIECVPRDDDECLASTPDWGSTKNCAYAKKYCDSWAKDARRCCPQTCGSGLLTESQCNALNSKGTCIYPNNVINQCPNEGIKDQVIHRLITIIWLTLMIPLKLFSRFFIVFVF